MGVPSGNIESHSRGGEGKKRDSCLHVGDLNERGLMFFNHRAKGLIEVLKVTLTKELLGIGGGRGRSWLGDNRTEMAGGREGGRGGMESSVYTSTVGWEAGKATNRPVSREQVEIRCHIAPCLPVQQTHRRVERHKSHLGCMGLGT